MHGWAQIRAEPTKRLSPYQLGEYGCLQDIGVVWDVYPRVIDIGTETIIDWADRVASKLGCRGDRVHRAPSPWQWLCDDKAESPSGDEVLYTSIDNDDVPVVGDHLYTSIDTDDVPVVGDHLEYLRTMSVARYKIMPDGSTMPCTPRHRRTIDSLNVDPDGPLGRPASVNKQPPYSSEIAASVDRSQHAGRSPAGRGPYRQEPDVASGDADAGDGRVAQRGRWRSLSRDVARCPAPREATPAPRGATPAPPDYPPPPPVSPPSHVPPQQVVRASEVIGVTRSSRSIRGRSPPPQQVTERPAWVCCSHGNRDPTVSMWYDALQDYGCDRSSVMGLIALGQAGPRSYMEANAIIGKLFKKEDDDIKIGNPSAFLAKNVKHARHAMNPEGSQHANLNGCPHAFV